MGADRRASTSVYNLWLCACSAKEGGERGEGRGGEEEELAASMDPVLRSPTKLASSKVKRCLGCTALAKIAKSVNKECKDA